jgi:hypothetical protein
MEEMAIRRARGRKREGAPRSRQAGGCALSVDAAANKGTNNNATAMARPNRVVLSGGPIAAVRTGHVSTSRRLVEEWGRWPLGLPSLPIYLMATQQNAAETTTSRHR